MNREIDQKKLSDIADIIMGQSPPSSSYNEKKHGMPFFQGKAEFGKRFPTPNKYCSKPIKFARKNDVLMSVRAPVGAVNLSNSDCCIGRGLCAVRPKNKSDLLYIYYYLKFKEKYIEQLGLGSTFKAINRTDISNIKIPVLPSYVKKKIALMLEQAENLKDKREQSKEETNKIIRSIFYEMFGDPLAPSEGKVKLKEVIEIIVPTRDKPKSFTGDIPWVRLPDLGDSIYIADSEYKLSEEEAKPTKTRLFPKETVILSCAGSLGQVAIAKKPIYTNQQFYGLVCNKNKIIPEFLACYLLLLGEEYYRNLGGTSTLTFFKKNAALGIEVNTPPIKQQTQFAQIVKKIESLKEKQQQSSEQINTLFDALMQKGFKGELVH